MGASASKEQQLVDSSNGSKSAVVSPPSSSSSAAATGNNSTAQPGTSADGQQQKVQQVQLVHEGRAAADSDLRILFYCGVTAAVLIAGYSGYSRYLVRYPTAIDIPRQFYNERWLYGKVTSVGDGDNFHFYHLPGGIFAGWGWARPVPKTNSRNLKGQTISVRLCGVDAPERAHFGKPAQPYGDEALQWLRDYILGRRIWVKPFHVDQYSRAVCKAKVWKWTGLKNVSAEEIRAGMGTVYEAKVGAEFDGQEEYYKKLEARAKRWHRGMWSLPKHKQQTPRQYKNKYSS